ncbi:MAG: thioredoxin family protein [Flavobacteriales bacterium]|nr:thioredoxin family protein [Flavobacteriales bacterium]MCX7650590.1 thioredoxin family protein [Flavobacteriales bacterium]MDW8431542.1 thioredoxin family protein [Flavobacteriales bacterium]
MGGSIKDPIDQELKDKPYVLVEFYAKWCMPCKVLEEVLRGISKTMKGISLLTIDVDKHPELSSRYHVEGLPSLMLIARDGVLWRRSGLLPEKYILTELEKVVPEELRKN